MPDTASSDVILAACMLVAAALYSSVGHAGATAYLALMAMFGLPPAVMRPTALVLNILVASVGAVRYWRAGLLRFRTVWPFLIGSIPTAILGGAISLPGTIYRPLVGTVLVLSAVRLLWPKELKVVTRWSDPPVPLAIAIGLAIGLLAGLTGTGGGVFLSPIILFFSWSAPKPSSGVVAAFILANSIAGLTGNVSAVGELPAATPLFAGAVLLGALVGTTVGIKVPTSLIVRLLAVVLLIGASKLFGLF